MNDAALDVNLRNAVFVVYAADGTPKIYPGWIAGLSAEHLRLVAENLRAHGWTLDAQNNPVRITNHGDP